MWYRPSGASATLWAALWSTAACSFDNPHAHDESACQQYARETCARLSSCSPWVVEQTYQTDRGCRRALATSCVGSLGQPDVLSSAAGVSGCAEAMKRVACSQLVNNELPSSCGAPRGRRPHGVVCQVDAQCASARCARDEQAGHGTCQELVGRGGRCTEPADCQPPLVCAANRRCTALGKRGVACSDGRPCRSPLSCLDDDCTLAATGVCRGDECDPRSPERIGTACGAYASALCNRIESCSPALLNSVYGERTRCEERTRGACERSASAADAVGTGAGIALCASALDAVSCEDVLNNWWHETCRPLPGRRENTRACSEHAQCASLRCARKKNEACGRCTEPAAGGEPCTDGSDCAGGLVCTSAQLCALPVAERGSCTTDQPCAFPLLCIGGNCVPTLLLGDKCDPMADRCNAFAAEVCGPLSMLCEPLHYEPKAGPCGYIDGGWTACSQGAACVNAAGKSHCVPAPADGEVCSTAGAPCLSPARCVDGLCVLRSSAECS
ncbi:MAG: hypothetical protein RLZZ450_3714 [Pseudomonadota bacterium]|jgi:hypothetical protein